jgi:hypothetical protein
VPGRPRRASQIRALAEDTDSLEPGFGGGGQPISSDQSTGAALTMALDAHYDGFGPVPWQRRLPEDDDAGPWKGAILADACACPLESCPRGNWKTVQLAVRLASGRCNSARRGFFPARAGAARYCPRCTIWRQRGRSVGLGGQPSAYGEKAAVRPMESALRTVKSVHAAGSQNRHMTKHVMRQGVLVLMPNAPTDSVYQGDHHCPRGEPGRGEPQRPLRMAAWQPPHEKQRRPRHAAPRARSRVGRGGCRCSTHASFFRTTPALFPSAADPNAYPGMARAVRRLRRSSAQRLRATSWLTPRQAFGELAANGRRHGSR